MKQSILLVLLLLVSINLMAEITVEGKAIIPGAENNEGIKISFLDNETGLLINFVLTNRTGYYKTILKDGKYNIVYEKGNLYEELEAL